jgi:hypothetical protein
MVGRRSMVGRWCEEGRVNTYEAWRGRDGVRCGRCQRDSRPNLEGTVELVSFPQQVMSPGAMRLFMPAEVRPLAALSRFQSIYP